MVFRQFPYTRVEASTGRIEITTGRLEITTGRVNVTSGRVEIASGRVEIFSGRITNIPVVTSITLISSGTIIPSGSEFLTTGVSTINALYKTIQGWTNFSGSFNIYTAPITGLYNPSPYSTQTVYSGKTFSFSFSELCTNVRVGIIPTATGSCGVWILLA